MATRNFTSAKKPKQAVLEVQVMFEPSRLAKDYLEKAYACLIPIVQHRPTSQLQKRPTKLEVMPQKSAVGGEI